MKSTFRELRVNHLVRPL